MYIGTCAEIGWWSGIAQGGGALLVDIYPNKFLELNWRGRLKLFNCYSNVLKFQVPTILHCYC